MTVDVLNPDNTTLQQLDGQWQKMCAMLVWKLARKGVALTVADFKEVEREHPEGLTLLTHGHYDSIEFKLVSTADAKRLVEWDAQQGGRA